MSEDINPQKFDKLQETCRTLYIVYALGAVLQFFDDTMLAGMFAIAAAGFIAGRNKAKFRGTIFESHLRWMIRSLWIGGVFMIPATLLLTMLLLFAFTDLGALVHAFMSRDTDVIMGAVQNYLAANMTRLSVITGLVTALPVAWFVHRCWRGYELLRGGLPVDNVTSWI